jgi:hypothetical protein
MKKLCTVLAVVVLVPTLSACAPSPEKVCDHVVDLTKKELGDKVDAMSDEQMDKIRTDCVKNAQDDQKKNPKTYGKRAKCVMAASSLNDLRDCYKAEKDEK